MTRIHRDIARLFLMVVVGALLVLADTSNWVIIQAYGIGVFFVVGTHFLRRILFTKVDLQALADKADESPIGAAICFASIIAFLVAVMQVSLTVLK